MNKNKICRYVRILTAAVIGILAILAFAGIFYPVKIFDLQVSSLAQRVIIDFSLAAALLFVGVLLLTLLLRSVRVFRLYVSQAQLLRQDSSV